MRWKMRKKCSENVSSILWIFIISYFFSDVNFAQGNYAEADDLVNELDRPSEYY